jgi:acetyl esterase/lipase
MKVFSVSLLVLIFLNILNVNAGFLIPNLIAFTDNYINFLSEKNVSKDIKYGGSSSGTLDVFYNKKDTSNLKPVVIFVHGGAWIFGNKYEYSKIGSLLVREDYVGVLPNYVLFPRGSIDDMVDDLYKAIKWTYNNISKYGGNKNEIILTGHSAGAHIAALTAFKASLDIKNNGKTLGSLPKLKKLVLFNGPYDFDDYDPSRIFGYTDIESGLSERLVSILVNNKDVSPTDLLKKFKDGSVESLGAPVITLFAADKDQLVPHSSSNNLSKQIRRVSPSTTLNYVFSKGNNFDHFTLILGAISNNNELEQMFMDICEM